jgi:outer membrane protein assembly factor BamD (BamD/ComL family)
MHIKTLVFVMFISIFLTSCKSTDIERKSTVFLEMKEINGIKQYEKGNYEKAFNLLKEPAAWGYKGSQYALAFMFLKGNYVQQSTLLGMGWLGVAKEANVKEWTEQYNTFYTTASNKEKKEIDVIVEEYIKRYGLISQDVTCKKAINAYRRVDIKCHKYDGIGIIYPVDVVE